MLDATPITPERGGDPRCRAGRRWSSTGRSSRLGIDRSQVAAGAGGRVGPQLATARRHRRGAVRQAGRGRGRQGVRRGDRLPQRGGAAGVRARLRRDPGRGRRGGRAAARADPRVRRADPRHRRRGHRRDDRGGPRPLPGRRPAPGCPACRRGTTTSCAARPASWSTRCGSDDEERELFREEPVAGQPLKLTLDIDLQQAAERLLAGVGPGQRAGGDPAVDRRHPGRGERPRQRRLQHGDVRPVRARLDVQERQLAGAAARRAHPRRRCVPCTNRIVVDGKAFENYDDYPSGAGSAGSRCGRRSRTPATPPSSPRPTGSATTRSPTRPPRSGMGVDHDLGFPAYFGSVEPPASETEKAADMIGQGTILASPMVMATVAASIQSGTTVLPRLVKTWEVEQADVPELTRAEADAAARHAARRGHLRQRQPPGRRTRAAGDRQDRHRGVREERQDPSPTPG